MTRHLLDTSALVTLRDDESGAARVAELLKDGRYQCLACFMTRMEILYRIWKDEGETAGRLALEQCRALPLAWIEQSEPLLLQVATIKACHPVSLADAWIAAAAVESGAILVHKDPEFFALDLEQESLPLK